MGIASAPSVLAAIAITSAAVGGLVWAAGFEKLGRRWVAFGVVLCIVDRALVANAQILSKWFRANTALLVAIVVGLAALVALGRILANRTPRPNAALSKKKRVARGP